MFNAPTARSNTVNESVIATIAFFSRLIDGEIGTLDYVLLHTKNSFVSILENSFEQVLKLHTSISKWKEREKIVFS